MGTAGCFWSNRLVSEQSRHQSVDGLVTCRHGTVGGELDSSKLETSQRSHTWIHGLHLLMVYLKHSVGTESEILTKPAAPTQQVIETHITYSTQHKHKHLRTADHLCDARQASHREDIG